MSRTMSQNKTIEQFKVTEVELVYRHRQKPEDRYKITGPECAYNILLQSWDRNRIELIEEFKILLMDRGHTCLGISTISSGGMAYCVVDPKIVFATALKGKASAIILAHNHPSGNLNPSDADIALTKKLVEGGQLLEIAVPDHLIVTPYKFYSMAENALL